MLRFLVYAALGLLPAMVPASLVAQPTVSTGPPAWHDNHSVYLTVPQNGSPGNQPTIGQAAVDHKAGLHPPAIEPMQTAQGMDRAVVPALYSTERQLPAGADQRYLAPPSGNTLLAGSPVADQNGRSSDGAQRIAGSGVPLDSIYTVLSALAIVVGVFLTCVWILRRGARTTATSLPADVVSVLGRVPLATRQFAQLLRVGNKLVLVSLSPSGAETLTEVTDSAEVDRLVGLCQQLDPHSNTKAFEQVFQQLSRETAPTGFLGGESMLPTLSPKLEKLRVPRQEAARA